MRSEDASVRAAWARRDTVAVSRQMIRAPTLALVKALHMPYDEDHDPALWPTPREALEERHRNTNWRGDSRDRTNRISGGGDPGGGDNQAVGDGGNGWGGDH